MKTRIAILSLLFAFISLPALTAWSSSPVDSEYERHDFEYAGYKMPYRLLSPERTDSVSRFPLVIFLHGSGERGTDNERQLQHGGALFADTVNAEEFPAYVMFPQIGREGWTGEIDPRQFMPGADTPEIALAEVRLMHLVKHIIHSYPIDTDRIYIIGLSMGGIATYDLVCRFPDLFAAAVPICGAVNPERLHDAKEVNFMIFHGEKDRTVPIVCGREAFKSLEHAGANVRYIEFKGEGHDCWDSAFEYPTLLPWLFSQSRNTAATTTQLQANNP